MTPISDFQPFQACSPQEGTITQWEDEKGFGWVKSGEKRVFVHIKEFERGQRRPKAGEEIRYITGIDAKGRNCAKQVTFVKSGGRGRVGVGGWILLSGLLVLPGLAMLWLPVSWWMGACVMTVISAITYGMYADDKQRATAGAWRVPESSLHLAELLGGWPGAFLAQRRLRHKCSKSSYQVVFWFIVVIFQIVAVDLMLDQRLSQALMRYLAR
jgi:uncharacterized membrane protein YsdA (DUF1294 family)/cold shock CspA family protein